MTYHRTKPQRLASRLISAIVPLLFCLPGNVAVADASFDVDEADGMDFESFHRHKDNSIKIYDSGETGLFGVKKTPASETQGTATGPGASTTAKPPHNAGNPIEIRQRYALDDNGDFSANRAIQALYRQMASHCPAGWRKLSERSEPATADFYLYYVFECIEK